MEPILYEKAEDRLKIIYFRSFQFLFSFILYTPLHELQSRIHFHSNGFRDHFERSPHEPILI